MFFDRLKKLCDERGISAYKACTDIGLNRAAVAKWKNGSIPSGSTAAKLADYFGVTTDYLLGKENKKAPTVSGERSMSDDELMFALWGDCQDVDEADLEDVRRYAAFVRERKKGKK